jgi:branched-chain amino acid transport system substrate-binding protein
MGTAFQNAWFHDALWNAMLGWTGVDQYDEANQVGQTFLDEFESAHGRRPEWVLPLVNRDFATVLLHAFADAHPLSPRGVKDALERVKMVPAAAGAPGTRLSFGKWTRRGGWVRATSSRGAPTPTACTRTSSPGSAMTETVLVLTVQ